MGFYLWREYNSESIIRIAESAPDFNQLRN
jgi:hypothetical protein